jgi:hypothetical protein
MEFNPAQYGPVVAGIFALDAAPEGSGNRLAPLVCAASISRKAGAILAQAKGPELFPNARRPMEATVGLWLYFSFFEEAHQLVDVLDTKEAALWHGIVHRMEPDSGNAAYWYRRAGRHDIFRDLAREASRILQTLPDAEFRVGQWDPYSYLAFCDRARVQPNSSQERAAREIQRAEWQILFDYCARPAA